MTTPSTTHDIPGSAEKVFSGKIFDVWHWEQELFDGSKTTFERLSRSDYAYVIGVLPDRKILLIQDEQPDRGPVLTPAGGKVESGESAADAATREFMEETGYSISHLTPWHTYRPSNKIQMQIHAFIGRDIRATGKATPEAGERITLKTFTFEEFLALGHSDELRDWMLRIKLLQAQLNPILRDKLTQLLYG